MNRGFTLTTPTFLSATSSSDIDLTSITILKNGAPYVGDEVVVCLLDNLGLVNKAYLYIDEAEDPNTGDPVEAWVDMDECIAIQPGEIQFTAGQGFWIQADSDGFTLQFSGKICFDDVLLSVSRGFSLSGNILPIDLDLTDMIITTANAAPFAPYVGDEVVVCLLDNLGLVNKAYLYIDEAEDPNTGDPVEAWVDMDECIAIQPGEIQFTAGQGFWIQADNEGFNLYIPSVEF